MSCAPRNVSMVPHNYFSILLQLKETLYQLRVARKNLTKLTSCRLCNRVNRPVIPHETPLNSLKLPPILMSFDLYNIQILQISPTNSIQEKQPAVQGRLRQLGIYTLPSLLKDGTSHLNYIFRVRVNTGPSKRGTCNSSSQNLSTINMLIS